MPTTGRPQQHYHHRLRSLVQRTGDVTAATELGVPRSTARGWLNAALCDNSADDLSGGAVVELEHAAESLTASDRSSSDRRNRGRDERILQALVREDAHRHDHRRSRRLAFLGFEFRWVPSTKTGRWYPCTTPRPKKITLVLQKVRDTLRASRHLSVAAAVAQVNPILRGRVNYFRVGNSSQAFNKVQYHVERKVRRFAAKQR